MITKTSKILSDEHKYILKVADAVEKECSEIKQGKKINDEFFKKIIEFIRNYADKFHHAKEEDILFKEFCKQADKGKVHCNPVEQMLFEHDEGRNFVRGIEDGQREKNRNKVVENALGYVNLIREHIYKEDNILYPMADEVMDNKTEKEMEEKFEEINKKRQADKENFERFSENLK